MISAMACTLALNFLGIDHARSVTLAVHLLLVIVAVEVHVFGLRLTDLRTWPRRLAYLLCLRLGPMRVISLNAWLF